MSPTALIVCLMTAVLGAAGLHAIAPRRTPGLYLAPAARTAALITAAVLYVAIIWSHS